MDSHIQNFLSYVSAEKGYSANTRSAYAIDLEQFAEYLLAQPRSIHDWAQVDKDAIVGFILHLKGDRQYASATVARKVAAIKSFFHFLWREGIIPDDPTATLDSPRVEKRLPRALTLEEVKRLLAEPAKQNNAKGLRDRALLELAYATGMRASELVALNLDDVSLASASVRCWGKGSKERIIPVHARAVRVLQEYLEKGRRQFLRNPAERALFLNQRGEGLTRQGLWLIIKGYVEQAGLSQKVTPHTLRHSFATHMLDGDADLINVQQLLGHANVSTTQIYTHVTTERLREVYDQSHPRAK
ncbi:MAG: site-specific tyrosine recombinase XerD [Chloroflexi bacterium]|nr:site-specific tyrosine recombinase XerD [Chloroflexota bacterium]